MEGLLHFETIRHAQTDSAWICLIHGAGGSINTWKKQRADLSNSFNLLLIDLPGHGNSTNVSIAGNAYTFDYIGKKIWDVIEHIQVKSIHLVGVSLGTIIALHMEKMKPGQVLSLVLTGAIVRLNTKLKVISSLSLALSKVIGYPAFYKMAARIALPKKNHAKSREIFIRESKKLTDLEFEKWTAMYGKYLNQTLKTLFERGTKIPALLIMGKQDHLFLASARKYAQKHLPVRIEIIQKCGHIVSLEKPKIFNMLSAQFFKDSQFPTKVQSQSSENIA